MATVQVLPTKFEGSFSNMIGKFRNYFMVLTTTKLKNSKPFCFSNNTCKPVVPEERSKNQRESVMVYAWPQDNMKEILKCWVR